MGNKQVNVFCRKLKTRKGMNGSGIISENRSTHNFLAPFPSFEESKPLTETNDGNPARIFFDCPISIQVKPCEISKNV